MFHIVDDDSYLGDLLGQIMITLGYKVKVFSCPNEYIRYAKSEAYDIPIGVITDVDMPIMNGYEMMKEVHCVHPSLKFIATTGDPYIEHEYKEKACMFIKKPIRPDLLAAITHKLADCLKHGASDNMGCVNCDDKDSFCLTNWMCPHPYAT